MAAPEPTYDVFLSYANPDTDAVAELARQFERVGLRLYLPADHALSGMPYEKTIEQGLEQSRVFLVFLGPSGLGPHQTAEVEGALAKHGRDGRYHVILVFLPGASDELPLFLRRRSWMDLRNGLDSKEIEILIWRIQEALSPADTSAMLPAPAAASPPSRIKDVWLATAAPPSVARNSKFVARFSAYTEEYRSQVTKVIETEAPETKLHLDLHTCQWERGTKVTVALSADRLQVEESPQSFTWNGKWVVLRFDVSVPDSFGEGSLILKFDVSIEGLIIARLRPELKVVRGHTAEEKQLTSTPVPKKAFASYASQDRREVLARIRSLQIFTPIDVFLDCLSIHPGESWKARIKDEIDKRDIFWLFWSQNAQQSSWVDWEWRTALATRDLAYIQPHPLEGPETAPPPAELAALQFGTLYESLLGQVRSSWWHRRITQCRRAARRVAGLYWLLALILLVVVAYLVWFR